MPVDPNDTFVSIKYAAQRLNVRPQWLYEHKQELAFVKRFGRRPQ